MNTLELKELLEYLTLSDIYLFFIKDPDQAVSWYFAYAMSYGCAVISTQFPMQLRPSNIAVLLKEFNNRKEFKSTMCDRSKIKRNELRWEKTTFHLSHG
jgi:hypothetical protein